MFSHLLPNARAWRLTVTKTLKQFFEGLEGINSDIKTFFDLIWLDIFSNTTRELGAWEFQLGLTQNGLTEQERRDRIDAARKALGGQSPRYIQDTLQANGFDVYVHEWWEVPVVGSPVVRNPLTYLDDGSVAIPFTMYDGGVDAQDGDADSQDGGTSTPIGYLLVNKIITADNQFIGDGSTLMQDGGVDAQDGDVVVLYGTKQYTIPVDPAKWPYFLYIGGSTFPDVANLSESRKEEFEDLCLKLCPTEQWLGILVTYS